MEKNNDKQSQMLNINLKRLAAKLDENSAEIKEHRVETQKSRLVLEAFHRDLKPELSKTQTLQQLREKRHQLKQEAAEFVKCQWKK